MRQVEKQLKLSKFPPSFRHFVLVTGGHWVASLRIDTNDRESNLSPINEIGIFKDVDTLNWNGWHRAMGGATPNMVPAEEYYQYGDKQDNFRWEYLNKLIKVGELEQGAVLLLNPLDITADGEWEAWLLSTKVGALRYRSFAELMQTVAYQEIRLTGGVHLNREQMSSACGAHLKTAVTTHLPTAR